MQALQTPASITRAQRVKMWELRAATSLASLSKKRGQPEEARQALRGAYNRFTEGFDAPDLREARKLLDDVSRS